MAREQAQNYYAGIPTREFNQNRKAEVLMIRLVNELTRMALSE